MSVYVSDAQENSNQPLTGICSFQYSPNQKFSHSSETGLTAVEYWQMAILSSLSCHSKIPELASTKKSNKHAVHHPKRKCHTYTQCPHISRMLLFEKGLMFGVRTFPTFHLREFLLWEHVGHRSPLPAGSSQEPDPTSIILTVHDFKAKCVPTIKLQASPVKVPPAVPGHQLPAFPSSSSDAAFNTWRWGWKKCSRCWL